MKVTLPTNVIITTFIDLDTRIITRYLETLSKQPCRVHLNQIEKIVDVSGPAITTLNDESGRKRFVGGSSQSHNISPADTVKER
uniref:Uncharacterized protein n=1 Tax=Caenorhabditis japonica TaxID=281687 RepID=A0A8R1EK55_CAEJA